VKRSVGDVTSARMRSGRRRGVKRGGSQSGEEQKTEHAAWGIAEGRGASGAGSSIFEKIPDDRARFLFPAHLVQGRAENPKSREGEPAKGK